MLAAARLASWDNPLRQDSVVTAAAENGHLKKKLLVDDLAENEKVCQYFY